MCRFVLYLGQPVSMASLITEPANSLIHQSFESKYRVEPLNGDGFGVAWYVPAVDERPALFKSITPAWNNRNLQHIARVTHSTAILAHVRAATSSLSVTEPNCHPFTWQTFAFCHNGDVGGFKTIRRTILAGLSDEAFHVIQGTTDSEHAFSVWVDRYLKSSEPDPTERMAKALLDTIETLVRLGRDAGVEDHSYLNFAVTDGKRAAVAHCTTDADENADSLFVNIGRKVHVTNRMTRVIPKNQEPPGAVIVSSEPLSNDEGWRSVPVNQLLVVDPSLTVTTRDILIQRE